MVRLRCRGMDITNILPQTAAVSICRATGGCPGVDESSIASSPRYPQHLLCLVERSTWGERHKGLFLQSHAYTLEGGLKRMCVWPTPLRRYASVHTTRQPPIPRIRIQVSLQPPLETWLWFSEISVDCSSSMRLHCGRS